MTLRTLVCAAIALLGATFPAPAPAQTATGLKFAPLNPDGTLAGGSAVVVTCEASKGGLLGRVPTSATLVVSAGQLANGQASAPITFALVTGTSVYSGSATWTTPPQSGAVSVRCEVATTSTPSVVQRTVAVAGPSAEAPVVTAFTAPSGPLFVGEQAALSVTATDPAGRPLTYTWSAARGTLAADGPSATWTAPDVAGTTIVQVTVRNDLGASTTRSTPVEVLFSAYRDALPVALDGPRAMASTPEGDLFVADASGRLHRLTRRGERVATSLSGVTAVAAAEGVVFAAVPGAILKLDPFTGRLLGRIELGPSRPPPAMAWDAGRSLLWLVNPSGAVEGLRLDGSAALTIPVRMPRDVAVDAAGRVWVALAKNEGGNMLHAFDGTTGAKIREIVPSGQGAGNIAISGGLTVDAAGRLFVSDFFSGTVLVVSADGSVVASLGRFGDASGALRQPAGLAHLANGDLVVANMDVGRIDRFGTRLPLPVCAGDADCDGLPDDFESAHGLNPADPSDALADLDGDGLNNAEELVYGTRPDASDTDGDGYADPQELATGFDPRDPNDHRPRLAAEAPPSSWPGLVRVRGAVTDPVAGRACDTAWVQLPGTTVVLLDPATASPSFVARAAGVYRLRGVATCGGVASLPVELEVAVRNAPPVADGGRLLTVPANSRETLSGERSSDANGDALAFAWDQVLGPPVTATVEDASLTARMRQPGYYVFRLGVTDAGGAEGAAEVPVLVVGDLPPPAAVASSPLAAQAGESVTLDASGSYASARAAFSWQQVEGATVALRGEATATPSFAPPAPGRYAFEVTVVDGSLRSPPARVEVYAAEAGAALPVAAIAFPGTAAVGVPVALDGSASAAASGGGLAYAWRQVAGPAAGLTETDAATARFVAFGPGSYEIELVVTDRGAASHPARVRFEARKDGRPIPVAVASAPSTARVGENVMLDAGGSTGARNFRWTQVDGPWVTVDQGRVAHFVPTAPGVYAFELEVDDGAVVSAPVRATVVVFAESKGGR